MKEIEVTQLCIIKETLKGFSEKEKELFLQMLRKELGEKAESIIEILNIN